VLWHSRQVHIRLKCLVRDTTLPLMREASESLGIARSGALARLDARRKEWEEKLGSGHRRVGRLVRCLSADVAVEAGADEDLSMDFHLMGAWRLGQRVSVIHAELSVLRLRHAVEGEKIHLSEP